MLGPKMGSGARRRVALLLALLVACAGNTAPPHFLPSPAESQTDGYGGWIELTVKDRGGERRVEGELIAVSDDTVRVLRGSGGGVVVPTAQVQEGKLTAYRPATGAVTGYAALGTVSTISNGILLVFTAPLWIITGTAVGVSESRAPEWS